MFVCIKQIFGPESCFTSPLFKSQRYLVALLRTVIFPLVIDFGRFKNIQEGNRLCDMGIVEVQFSFTQYILGLFKNIRHSLSKP